MKINGTVMLLNVDGDPIAHETNVTLNIDRDLPDASSKSSVGFAEHINGIVSWSMEVSALADFAATVSADGIGNAILNGTSLTVLFLGESGHEQWTGAASVANLSVTSDFEQPVTWGGTLTGNGLLTQSTTA